MHFFLDETCQVVIAPVPSICEGNPAYCAGCGDLPHNNETATSDKRRPPRSDRTEFLRRASEVISHSIEEIAPDAAQNQVNRARLRKDPHFRLGPMFYRRVRY